MGIRIRTGIGPVRVSIPLTPRRRRRRRTVYRTTVRRPAAAGPSFSLLRRMGPISWAVILFIAALGSTDHPADMVLFLLGSIGLGWWGWTRRQQQQALALQQAQIQAARAAEIATYHQFSAAEFEQAIAYLCQRDGCTSVQVVGGAGDLGADVIATTPDGRRLILQCKRYTPGHQVTGPDLQKFGGTCYSVHQAGVAAVVTTSGFTKQARQYAGHMRIGLWDNDALAGWASRTGPAPWM